MAVLQGLTGTVTSWATAGSSPNADILAAIAPQRFSLDYSGDVYDTTSLSGSLTAIGRTGGMASWTATIEGNLATPTLGAAGSFDYGVEYDTNVRAWTLNLKARAHPNDAFGQSAGGSPSRYWRAFLPGIMEVDASFEAEADSGTALSIPANSAATATFDMDGTNKVTVSGITNQTGIPVAHDQLIRCSYSLQGTGGATAVGAGALLGFAAGAIPAPEAGSLVLKTDSDNSYTGDAFWTGITVTCRPGELIRVTVNLQGTGALTQSVA